MKRAFSRHRRLLVVVVGTSGFEYESISVKNKVRRYIQPVVYIAPLYLIDQLL